MVLVVKSSFLPPAAGVGQSECQGMDVLCSAVLCSSESRVHFT